MRRILVLIAMVVSSALKAQTSPAKFGEIAMEELTMKTYPADTSANAIILFDKGESTLEENLSVTYKRHMRIKFFTKASIDDWASRTIYLTKGEDFFSKLKASCYNLENGKIVESKMEETSVFKTKYDRYTEQIKFTIPNVKEGSVIEFSYVLKTSASLLPSWQFQYGLPSVYSEYQTSIPKSFTFRKEMKGFLSISDVVSKYDGSYEKLVMKDVPAFKDEPFTTNPDDFISSVDFHITEVFVPGNPLMKFGTTWPKLVNDLLEDQDFGVQIKTSGFLKNIVAEITAGMANDEQKAKAIYEYVKAKVEWNKIIDKIPDHPFKKVLEEKKGSTSEINLLLVSMLQKAGISADPVLISTRKHGRINPFYPAFRAFNDVICLAKINGKNVLLDGTSKGLPMNALPERCLNGEGLVVSKEGMSWVPLVSIRSRKAINADYKLNAEGELKGKITISRDGLEAADMRETYKDLGEEKYVKNFLSGRSWELTKTTFDNIENPNQSAKEAHDIVINDHTQVAGNIIYLNPYVVGRMDENIFKSEKRLYPVDYSAPFDRIYQAKIVIPDGYSVEELPKQKLLVLPANGGKFVYSASQIGNTINFISQLIINKSVFTAEEYPNLREFYTQIVAKQSEQIVLKKN